MLNGKKIFRVGLLGIFSCLFLTGNVHAISYLDLGQEGTPSQGYQPENYNIILDTNGEYKLEKNGETKNLMYGYVSVRGRPFLYYFGYYNDRLGVFQFMDDQPSYNQSTVNRIWYNATIYNYTTQSGKFLNGQTLPSANTCNSSKPDNDTWQCYFKLRDDFGEEYNEKIDGMIRWNNNGGFLPCFIYEELNEIVCMDQRTTNNSNNYANYDSTNRYNFETFNNTMGIYPTFIAKPEEEQETPIIYTGTITNQHAIYAYEQLGLTPQQCYGGYPIDTIYNTGTILYQGYQAGTGASILDLYNLYSGNYNGYQSTYMTEEQTKITQFLSEIYQGYENNGLSFFIGKPEALITIIQQYNNANQKATERGRGYTLFQLYTYCNLLINNNNNEEYTGNTATPDMRRNGIDTENQEIVLPVTGSVFDELQEDGEFKRNKAQDVRDTINSVYTKLTKIFNLRGGVQGIIPDYITRILLLIILFAIFKK